MHYSSAFYHFLFLINLDLTEGHFSSDILVPFPAQLLWLEMTVFNKKEKHKIEKHS